MQKAEARLKVVCFAHSGVTSQQKAEEDLTAARGKAAESGGIRRSFKRVGGPLVMGT